MLRKTCAHNNSAALSITSFRANHFNRRYVFFIIAIVLLASLPAISASPTGDKSAAANPALSTSVPGQAKPETAVAVSSPKSTTSIVVNVTINTQPRGDFFVEMDEGKNLFIRVEDIKALKLKYAEDRTLLINEEKYAPLSALPDVSYTFDEKKLIIAIIGKTTEEGKTAVDLFSLKPASQQNIYYPRETSAFLNYGLNYIYTNTDGFQSFAITNKVGFRNWRCFFYIRFPLYKNGRPAIILCGSRAALLMNAGAISSGLYWETSMLTPGNWAAPSTWAA